MAMGCMRVEQESPETVRQAVREFLERYPRAQVREAGERLFEMGEASYELSEEDRRVVLHLWSTERNVVRRLLSATRQGGVLRLQALRLGQRMPTRMELVGDEARELPMSRERARARYAELLTRVLVREFADFGVEGARSTTDLQHSFGPAFVRGVQTQGKRAWAFVGVGEGETQAVVDGVLTVGILWMAYLRERAGGQRLVGGLRLIVPEGRAMVTQSRLAWMDERIARYELYELVERTGELRRCDPQDRGNLRTGLSRAPEEEKALDADGRFGAALPAVLGLLPGLPEGETGWGEGARVRAQMARMGVETRLRTGVELAFLRHGLEFCRIRLGYGEEGFNRLPEVLVGAGVNETRLTAGNAGEMQRLVAELFARRCGLPRRSGDGEGERMAENDPLYRVQPERWLESRLRGAIEVVDESLCGEPVYAQVGALAGASDRGVIDLLARTREGRLAVLEVKTEEDLHLPLQGLDYWIRVHDHHLGDVDAATGLGDLQRQGYFPGVRLRAESPLLFLVAPALHIHPSTEVVLRHVHPSVAWQLVALDERWRLRLKPVWRRRPEERAIVA